MRPVRFASIAATALLALFVTSTIADAAPRRRALAARELTVRKRPFTDSGNVVPVGSQERYVTDTQSDHRNFPGVQRYSYGSETLPGRFETGGSGVLFNF